MLLGKPWLAVLALLVACVPLAGLTAYVAARRLRGTGTPVAVWAGATYALLPVATGAVATGRLGTVVVIVLLPLIGMCAGGMLRPSSRHSAWAAGLLLAVAMAFAPLTWRLAVLVGVPARYALGAGRAYGRRRLAIALGVPPLLLLPWTLHLLAHPPEFLLEAGLRVSVAGPQATDLIMPSPGGPGVPAFWVIGRRKRCPSLRPIAFNRALVSDRKWEIRSIASSRPRRNSHSRCIAASSSVAYHSLRVSVGCSRVIASR